jgi:hypothetical protein
MLSASKQTTKITVFATDYNMSLATYKTSPTLPQILIHKPAKCNAD